MIIKAVKTRALLPPKDDLLSVFKESISSLKENSVVVVTSKVVSIWEQNCIQISKIKNKDQLIKDQADFYIDRSCIPGEYVILTIKDNILIPTSGIDESNANGYYILWPKNPFLSAKKIYQFIKKEYKLKNFGVIISDSHTTPMRIGVLGIGLAYWGFKPLKDYRKQKDIFGRELKMSQVNIVDSLAAAAVFAMGEGSEQTPIAIIEDIDNIKFSSKSVTKNPLVMDREQDIYAPLLKNKQWKSGTKE